MVLKRECPVCQINPFSNPKIDITVDSHKVNGGLYNIIKPTHWCKLQCDHVFCVSCCLDFFDQFVWPQNKRAKTGCYIQVCRKLYS